MTKRVRVLVAVGTITALILIFIGTLIRTVPSYGHSSPESGRVEINAADRARIFLGLTSDLAPFDVSWSPRWISDGVVRITSILGANSMSPTVHIQVR